VVAESSVDVADPHQLAEPAYVGQFHEFTASDVCARLER